MPTVILKGNPMFRVTSWIISLLFWCVSIIIAAPFIITFNALLICERHLARIELKLRRLLLLPINE